MRRALAPISRIAVESMCFTAYPTTAMKIQTLHHGVACEKPSEWPCVLCEDELLAEPEMYNAVDRLEVGEVVKIGDGYEILRVE